MNKTPTAAASGKTSVVIPYYQEEPGILRGAVMSAIAQEGVSDLEIIVVDDGSPAPARDDLGDLSIPAHITLKLIDESNRGPGAARNALLYLGLSQFGKSSRKRSLVVAGWTAARRLLPCPAPSRSHTVPHPADRSRCNYDECKMLCWLDPP
jgi:cellulose synthase/poly-beta-1,6-N-acetylglucosamine synthase-like glycosyltransferase